MSTPVKVTKQGRQRLWRRHSGHLLGVLSLLVALPLLAQYDPKLQYQDRGNHYEGLKTRMVSGYDIELVSALVDWHEPSTAWPEKLHLKFYLPSAEPAFVTVRQPRPKDTFYWLDKVTPPAPWRAGALNEFAWPTEPVLRNLPLAVLDDLGVVVRLQQESPSKEEAIAPAALFHTQPPSAASAYRFTFKTNGAAHLSATIYKDNQPVYQRPQNQEKAGSPFTIRWDTQGHPEGEYRLKLSGYFDNDNTLLSKEILFYHRASWK
jgi:hypothetical protein